MPQNNDKIDDASKGQPSRAGESAGGARRPYATIDSTATEVHPVKYADAEDSGAGAGAAPESGEAGAAATSESERSGAGADDPSAHRQGNGDGPTAGDGRDAAVAAGSSGPFTGGLVTHLGAGAIGGLLVLLISSLFGTDHEPVTTTPPQVIDQITKRLTDAELALGLRPGSGGLGGRLDELARSNAALNEAQAKLAGDLKALENRAEGGMSIPSDFVTRLARLEEQVAAIAPGSVAAAGSGQSAEAAPAATVARLEQEIAAAKSDLAQVGQRIDAARSDADARLKETAKTADLAPLVAKIAALEQTLQGIASSEADRSANASRVVLSLELGNLKRVMERGQPYAAELAAVKKLAGDKLDLKVLERYMREGAPTTAELVKSFRPVANSMIDTEADTPGATVLERLWASARSIVRVRKAGHGVEDASLEGTIGRMEAALKEGRLGEVLAQSKSLPPKAALAGEDWLGKVAARQSVDQALAAIDAQLKASLGAARAPGAPATETR